MFASKNNQLEVLSTNNFAETLPLALSQIGEIVCDKDEVVKLLLLGFFARGHVLIEDVPGVGKTTLARSLAQVIGGRFSRIQLTSDLLPADIVGGQVLDLETQKLDFRPGPLFANIVLADELNRATPRTQSGMLEAMAERSVTIDGQSHTLDDPFMVIATQNPTEHHGVYPLPESQLDRFLIRTDIGYPGTASETELIMGKKLGDDRQKIQAIKAVWTPLELQAIFRRVEQIKIHPDVAKYLHALVQSTREHSDLVSGVSTRGALAFARAARARAFIELRNFVTPEDVKRLFLPVCAHRVVVQAARQAHRMESEAILEEILSHCAVPV